MLTPPESGVQLLGSLPPLPASRAASLTLTNEQTGAEFYQKSDNAIVAGDRLELESSASATAWGIWAFAPDEDALLAAEILVSVPEGQQAFVALSDYALGSWDIRGPVTGNVQYDITDEENLSPDGVTFVAVISSEAATSEVIQLVFSAERTGWQVVDVDSQYWTGFTPSLAVVDGNPAIAYRAYNADNTECALNYVRSNSAYGYAKSDWTNPVDAFGFPDPSFDQSNNCSLAVVNGSPVIAYFEASQKKVWCTFSSTPKGDNQGDWNHARGIGDPDNNRVFEYVSLIDVQGNPAWSAYDSQNGDLVYCHDIAAAGDDTVVAIDKDVLDDDGNPNSLRLIDGKPAIVFGDKYNNLLKYARSSTDTGADAADWSQVETIDNVLVESVSLITVLGNPAIAYWDRTNGNLKYMRATSSTGEGAWPQAPITADDTQDTGSFCGLIVTAGRPAIGYSNWLGDNNIYFKQATSATGSTEESWGSGAGEVVYTENPNQLSVADVNGHPALAWHSLTTDDLMYAVYLD